jgi:hypothetical protein
MKMLPKNWLYYVCGMLRDWVNLRRSAVPSGYEGNISSLISTQKRKDVHANRTALQRSGQLDDELSVSRFDSIHSMQEVNQLS